MSWHLFYTWHSGNLTRSFLMLTADEDMHVCYAERVQLNGFTEPRLRLAQMHHSSTTERALSGAAPEILQSSSTSQPSRAHVTHRVHAGITLYHLCVLHVVRQRQGRCKDIWCLQAVRPLHI